MVKMVLRRGGIAHCRLPGLLLLSLAVASLSSGLHAQAGGRAAPAGGCPKIAVPPVPSAIVWREGNDRREGRVTFFAFECLAEHHPAVETTSKSGVHRAEGAYTDYVIVVTVDLERAGDSQRYASVPIQAVSAKGVELGSSQFYFSPGASNHNTTRFVLSESEIQRVVKLTIGEPADNRL